MAPVLTSDTYPRDRYAFFPDAGLLASSLPGRKSMIHRRRGSSSTLLSAFESCFSGQGHKKCLLDALDHRTLVYVTRFKSCDSCASKRHLSRVTLYIYAASTPITFRLFLTLQQCFSFSGIFPFRLRISISPKQQWSRWKGHSSLLHEQITRLNSSIGTFSFL